jgi:hypothetical protein
MTQYIAVSEDTVPLGKTALLLFVHEAQLCAGTIEHRYDGRILKRLPAEPKPTQLVSVISGLMAGHAQDDLYVVIEADAYWPESFPLLNNKASIFK